VIDIICRHCYDALMMKRVKTILGYAVATAFCGFIVFAVSHVVFETDYAEGEKYTSLVDKLACMVLGVVFFSLVFAFMIVYNRYKLYKSFYDSMLKRIERFRIL
jgi:glucan phosphoethanolaminetransferase (alkaline phosphatase superfamily)